jgi:hypothetical protein
MSIAALPTPRGMLPLMGCDPAGASIRSTPIPTIALWPSVCKSTDPRAAPRPIMSPSNEPVNGPAEPLAYRVTRPARLSRSFCTASPKPPMACRRAIPSAFAPATTPATSWSVGQGPLSHSPNGSALLIISSPRSPRAPAASCRRGSPRCWRRCTSAGSNLR